MKDGILIINKPSGMTSFDAVAKIRRLYGTKQVGHTGTLDPMAAGVLVVLVGRAVKASEYAVLHKKSYKAGLKLGITTDTEDVTGRILTSSDVLPNESAVKEAVLSFLGSSMQVPPMYSALKVGGRKLCDLARQGITVEREAREIIVSDIVCETVNAENGEYMLSVSCSKGTYIRTLCADIGKKLGCGGVMSSLVRTETGGFTLGMSKTLAEIEALTSEERENLLIPTEELFSSLRKVVLPPFFAKLALAGNEIYLSKIGLSLPTGERVRLYDGSFFSLGEVMEFEGGKAIKPIKKFRI